jgi:exodeoxyribonuclease V gamma subunit
LVRGALASLAEGAHAGGCNEALDWQSVRAFLAERLAEPDAQQRFLSGGVSFCGMLPLRAIPFRVIAVLGLDDEAFPRREPANGINKLEHALRHARKLGDRSVRDDDRYLFLQLLTAADDVLHLSYVGRDLRTGNAREPSALVAELLDVVARDYVGDAKAAHAALVIEHPLQPFARVAFDGSRAGVFTYRDEWRAVAAAGRSGLARPFVQTGTAIDGADPVRRVTLDHLVDFWRNPARAFLRDTLHLDLYPADAPADDDDPLALDALANSKLKRVLVADALTSGVLPPREIDAAIQVRRQLPVGRAGADAYRQEAIGARQLAERIEAWRCDKTPLPTALFELELDDGWILECSLRQPYREGLLHWTPGEARGHHWLRPWIEYLALAAFASRSEAGFDAAVTCTHIALDKKIGVVASELRGLDAAGAREQLAALLRGYAEGQHAPLAFFPKAAWTYVRTLAGAHGNDTSEERALRNARSDYDSERGHGENTDAWIALAFRDRDPFADAGLPGEFEQHALRVFATLAGLLQGAAL